MPQLSLLASFLVDWEDSGDLNHVADWVLGGQGNSDHSFQIRPAFLQDQHENEEDKTCL